MCGGAGVERRMSKALLRLLRSEVSASTPSPIPGGLDQISLVTCDQLFAFLPGSGQRVECDVTHSKQTTAPFLPGATTAYLRSRNYSHFLPLALQSSRLREVMLMCRVAMSLTGQTSQARWITQTEL